MKKTVAFALALLYLVTSYGATVSFHYCMGKLIAVDISGSEPVNEKCSYCGMAKENKKGCCNDERQVIKINTDQLFSTVNIFPGNIVYYLNHTYPPFINSFTAVYAPISHLAHDPPLLPAPLFKLHCVFRI